MLKVCANANFTVGKSIGGGNGTSPTWYYGNHYDICQHKSKYLERKKLFPKGCCYKFVMHQLLLWRTTLQNIQEWKSSSNEISGEILTHISLHISHQKRKGWGEISLTHYQLSLMKTNRCGENWSQWQIFYRCLGVTRAPWRNWEAGQMLTKK